MDNGRPPALPPSSSPKVENTDLTLRNKLGMLMIFLPIIAMFVALAIKDPMTGANVLGAIAYIATSVALIGSSK